MKFLLSLLLSWAAATCAAAALYSASFLPRNYTIGAMLASFALGILLFLKWQFSPIYVFGHEMTHYLTAKLCLKETGKIRLGMHQGSVEIKGTNIIITLAPYFIPFYSILAILIYLALRLFFRDAWLDFGFACAASFFYSYHCLMTCKVLGIAQADLQIYGPLLSVSIILAGNMFLLLLTILIFTGEWSEAYHFICDITLFQLELIRSCF